MKIKVDSTRCKACYLCIEACPRHAITAVPDVNKNGVRPVTVDQEKCIQCGMCYRMCPDFVYEILDKEATHG